MRQLGAKKNLVNTWREMERKIAELHDMATLAIEEGDYSLEEEIQQSLKELTSQFEQMESRLILSGDYDSRNAMLALHAGAGGTESQDWANILLRMYLRWAERHDYEAEVLDSSLERRLASKALSWKLKGIMPMAISGVSTGSTG